MKKWCFFLLLLLLLTGCGKQEWPSTPYNLEVEYGDSGVIALQDAYSWSGREAEETDPLEVLSDIPFVNESKDKKIRLLFDEKPDTLEISFRSSVDSYRSLMTMEDAKTTFNVPTDGASYLYLVKASWSDSKDPALGGHCIYYFRYLPEHATGEQSQEMSLYRVVQMEAEDLFGVEFLNNLDGLKKTCTGAEDRAAILDYLKTYLSTNFVQIEMPEDEADYVLRLAVTMGNQVTLSYGGEGQNAWIMLDGVPYQAEVMDLYTLWEGLNTEAVPMFEEEGSTYLATSETVPLEGTEGTVHLGYIQSMEEGAVIVRTVQWIQDENEPNGYRLEKGDLATWTLAADCQYWVLDQHTAPWGQVDAEQLLQWSQEAGYDVLFHFHELDSQLLAIYEKYVP